MVSYFKKGDLVVPVDSGGSLVEAAVVMGITAEGLLRLRVGTSSSVDTYWPHDWRKIK